MKRYQPRWLRRRRAIYNAAAHFPQRYITGISPMLVEANMLQREINRIHVPAGW